MAWMLPCWICIRLGSLAAATGGWALARDYASAALRRRPCNATAARLAIASMHATGDLGEARQQVDLLHATCPRAASAIALEAIRVAHATLDYRCALNTCIEAMATAPRAEELDHLRLWRAYLTGASIEVETRIGQVLRRLMPRRRWDEQAVLGDAAKIAEAEGLWHEARELWSRVIKLNPGDKTALAAFHLLGARYLPLDEFRKELDAWQGRGGLYARVARRMAVFHAYYEQQDWQRAVDLSEPRGQFNQERPVLLHRALALARLGRVEQAQALLSEASDGAVPDSEVQVARAQIRRFAGDPAGQLALFNELLQHHHLRPLAPSQAGLRLPVSPASTPSLLHDGPLVSVIMPIYKRQSLLDPVIASVLNQSHRNLELWLVDDASPDDTLDNLHAWAKHDERIRVLSMPRNGGPYLAKNAAMEACSGSFIAFADSDDWNHPQRLERQVARLQRAPDAGGICVRYIRVDQDGNIVFRRTAVKTAWQSLMIRRETMETIGYFDALRAGADTEYTERISAVYNPAGLLVDQAIALLAAHHGTSLTGGGRLAMGWRPVSGIRQANHLAFRRWHRQCLAKEITPYLPHPLTVRPLHVPPELIADPSRASHPGDAETGRG
jgi:tetratricopeptide (TPR) repeat protein